jgi:insertion element IS1 protein InsB
VAFRVGSRGRKTLKKLLFLHPLRADIYATDHYRAYNILPQDHHIRSKAHTFTVESKNSQIRHYLARFHRRTKCYSKAVHMVIATLTIFFNRQLIHKLY